ncbi:MAG: methyltransferase domain-containing protein [Pyrinomonadaceae bacterium]
MTILKRFPLAIWLLCAVIVVSNSSCADSSRSVKQVAPSTPPTPTRGAPTVEIISKALDVPYVPTPPGVVAKMLELAELKPTDTLYDLGSGDGRIVITAAQKFGVQGVGFDLNPQRIRESNENARRAGVVEHVKFVEQDLFEVDLRDASVVTLYLLPDVNAKLLGKFQSELKPGTRVVSHNYPIGTWEPNRVVELDIDKVKHYVYFWVVAGKQKKSK